MKVLITYWSFGVGNQCPILGNTRGFREAGVEVEFIPIHRLRINHFKDADLFFTPSPLQLLKFDPPCFTVLQMGGRVDFPGLNRAVEHAELVTMLDPNLYIWFKEKGIELDWNKIRLVPNGLHYDLFKPKPPSLEEKRETMKVLTAKIGGTAKPGTNFIKVAEKVHEKGYKQIRFMAPVQDIYRTKWSNHIRPLKSRPYYKMPQLYREADVYLNVPKEEVLPNSIFESFMTGLPTVVGTFTHSIGRIQTVPTSRLEEMKRDFGLSIDEFHEKWSRHYDKGDHYLKGSTIDEVANKIIHLYENPSERFKYGMRALLWAETLNWTWKMKAELILKLAEMQKR